MPNRFCSPGLACALMQRSIQRVVLCVASSNLHKILGAMSGDFLSHTDLLVDLDQSLSCMECPYLQHAINNTEMAARVQDR